MLSYYTIIILLCVKKIQKNFWNFKALGNVNKKKKLRFIFIKTKTIIDNVRLVSFKNYPGSNNFPSIKSIT